MDKQMVFDTLVVDDSVLFRETLKTLLSSHYPAMSVTEAENGTELWQRLSEGRPQLIFMDIRLQDEDGLELVRRIRQIYHDVIVAVITGFDGPEYRKAAYSNGADCFIPKNSATTSDILGLVESIHSGQSPQWTLGSEYLNPSPPGNPWK